MIRTDIVRVWLFVSLLVASGCVKKDPLRAPWLFPGFYPAAKATAAAAPTVAPVAAPASAAVTVPPVDGEVVIEVPGLGRVVARVHAPGTEGTVYVPPSAPPVRVLDAPARATDVPGFLYGVDVRAYHSVAVVIDTAAWACEGYHSDGWHPGPPAPHLAKLADQLYAALAGLDLPDDHIAIFSGAEGHVRRLWMHGADGRLAARAWVRGTVCAGHQAIAPLLREAFAVHPDVVLVLSDGGGLRPAEQGFAAQWCAEDHDPLPCTGAADFARGAADRRPVIAVSVSVADSAWMKALADATGGAYVDASH